MQRRIVSATRSIVALRPGNPCAWHIFVIVAGIGVNVTGCPVTGNRPLQVCCAGTYNELHLSQKVPGCACSQPDVTVVHKSLLPGNFYRIGQPCCRQHAVAVLAAVRRKRNFHVSDTLRRIYLQIGVGVYFCFTVCTNVCNRFAGLNVHLVGDGNICAVRVNRSCIGGCLCSEVEVIAAQVKRSRWIGKRQLGVHRVGIRLNRGRWRHGDTLHIGIWKTAHGLVGIAGIGLKFPGYVNARSRCGVDELRCIFVLAGDNVAAYLQERRIFRLCAAHQQPWRYRHFAGRTRHGHLIGFKAPVFLFVFQHRTELIASHVGA